MAIVVDIKKIGAFPLTDSLPPPPSLHFIFTEYPCLVQIFVRKKFLNNASKKKKSEPLSRGLQIRIEGFANEKSTLDVALLGTPTRE